ncbi:MAG: metallophosphoesterase, partial [Lachnospiraceae bacterium]|nr:metallophosphoesterase [Lachnospiraceae bacterium]
MKKGINRVLGLFLVLALAIGLMQVPAQTKAAEKQTITILETSDIHGMLMNHDYATDTPQDKGLVQAATVIAEQRKIDPDLIYVDDGDLLQGNMISEFRSSKECSPAIEALNYLKCDAWELGNHEFNYEFDTLEANIKGFKGTVLGGNIYKADGTRFVNPYLVKEINGVKVAIIGVDAPHVTRWESDKSHYNNMKFTAPGEEIGNILNELDKD